MKLTKRCGLLATAAASLALSLSTFSTSTSAALIIELSPLEVRAAKDADPFVRELEQEEGPQSLVLSEENLFVSATGVAKTGPGEEDFVTNGTLVEWYIDAAGTKFEQVPAEVGANGEVVFLSDFGVGDAVNWIHVKTRGDNTIKLVVFGDFSNSTEATVFTISDFESVFPLLALIVLSLLSRNVYISMFFGIWFGSLVIEGGDIAESFRQLFDRHMIPTLIDEYNFRTITFALFLAGFIAMIKRSGGQDGFSDFIAKYATSPRRTQFAAVAAGVGLFFDDYSSALIIGSSFKKLTDRFHVSREKLAFVVDSTAAPIASMAPISSWIAFELSRIKPELDNIIASSRFDSKFDLPKEYAFFLNTIPSRYYPFYMLVLQVTFILAGVEFGPMLYTERKTRLERRLDGGDGATDLSAEADLTNPEPDTPRKAWNFFVPLGFFIVSLLTSLINIGKDSIYANNFDHPDEKIELNAREVFGHTDAFFSLVYTTIGSSLFCLVFYLIQVKKDGQIVLPTPASICMMIDCRLKKADDVAFAENLKEKEDEDKELGPSVARPLMQFTEGVNIWVEGFKNLVPAILILCMAFTIKSIVKGCATDRFFTDIILNGDLGAEYLPTIIFFVASLLSFSTGTSFGTMSIMFPLVSFATWEKSEGDQRLFTVAMSSIMAGAVFGDHSSLISDTTILSSIGSGCTIGTHVYTQLPYALWGALFAMILGTLPAGAGADAVTMLIIGGAILAVVTIAVSAPIVARNGRLDRFSELVLLITKSESLQSVKDKTVAFTSDPDNEDMIDPEPLEQVVIGVKYLISLVRGKVAVAEPIADAEAVKVVDATGEEASTPVKPAEATGAAANEVEGDMNKKMSL